jgi:hypothetical protein
LRFPGVRWTLLVGRVRIEQFRMQFQDARLEH